MRFVRPEVRIQGHRTQAAREGEGHEGRVHPALGWGGFPGGFPRPSLPGDGILITIRTISSLTDPPMKTSLLSMIFVFKRTPEAPTK